MLYLKKCLTYLVFASCGNARKRTLRLQPPPYDCVSHWQQRYSVESLSIHHSTVMFLSISLAWKNTISPSKMNTLSKYKLSSRNNLNTELQTLTWFFLPFSLILVRLGKWWRHTVKIVVQCYPYRQQYWIPMMEL